MRCPYCRTSSNFLVKFTRSLIADVGGSGNVTSRKRDQTVDVLCAECRQVIVGDDKKEILQLIHEAGGLDEDIEFLPKE